MYLEPYNGQDLSDCNSKIAVEICLELKIFQFTLILLNLEDFFLCQHLLNLYQVSI